MADERPEGLDPQNIYVADGKIPIQNDGSPTVSYILSGVLAPKIIDLGPKTVYDKTNDLIRVSTSGGDEEQASISEFLRRNLYGDVYEVDVYNNAGTTRYCVLSLQKSGSFVFGYIQWVTGLGGASNETGSESGTGDDIVLPDEFEPYDISGLEEGVTSFNAGRTGGTEKYIFSIIESVTLGDFKIKFDYDGGGTFFSLNQSFCYRAQNTDIYIIP